MKIFKKSKKHIPDILLELETLLNEPRFFDIPVGSSLASIYYLDFFINNDWKILSILIDFLRFQRYFFFPPRQKQYPKLIKTSANSKKILITSISERKEFLGLIIPITKFLDKSDFKILGAKRTLKKNFDKEIDFISWEEIGSNFDDEWKKEYLKKSKKWHIKIKKFLKKEHLPFFVFWKLALGLLIQSNRIHISKKYLQIENPKLLLTEFDRYYFSSPLILSAKNLKIPTVTLQHGVINSPHVGYTPLLADHIFCWGNEHKDLLMMGGVDPETIHITGNQRFSKIKPVFHRKNLISDIKKSGKLIVTLATSPEREDHRAKFALDFCKTMTLLETKINAKGIVRLHPSEKIDFYREIKKSNPHIRFSINNELTTEEIYEVSDIIVVCNSGFGNDAIIADKIVIVFNPNDLELGNGKCLINNAGCPYTKNSLELVEEIIKIQKNPIYKQLLLIKCISYKYNFCLAYDVEATKNVVEELAKIIA